MSTYLCAISRSPLYQYSESLLLFLYFILAAATAVTLIATASANSVRFFISNSS